MVELFLHAGMHRDLSMHSSRSYTCIIFRSSGTGMSSWWASSAAPASPPPFVSAADEADGAGELEMYMHSSEVAGAEVPHGTLLEDESFVNRVKDQRMYEAAAGLLSYLAGFLIFGALIAYIYAWARRVQSRREELDDAADSPPPTDASPMRREQRKARRKTRRGARHLMDADDGLSRSDAEEAGGPRATSSSRSTTRKPRVVNGATELSGISVLGDADCWDVNYDSDGMSIASAMSAPTIIGLRESRAARNGGSKQAQSKLAESPI